LRKIWRKRGRKRNVTTWAYDNVQAVPSWLYRGYTGHEHLDAFGLINMNARLYDPVLGRMLSPDNFVGDAGTQGFNRYSYANNNPLSYTDPSGNLPFFVIPLIYGAVNLAADAIQGNIKNFGDGVKSFAIGAAQGVLAGMGNPGLAAWKYAANAALSHVPGVNIGGNGFSLSISPSLSFGSDIFSFGANVSAGIRGPGGAFLGLSVGGGYSTNNYDILGSKISGFEGRTSLMYGIDNPDFSFITGSNQYYSGASSQRTGFISFNIGQFHASYENDGAPFGKYDFVDTDSKGHVISDGYRTAAISAGWGDFSVETRMFTGFRDVNAVPDYSMLNGAAPYGWVSNPEIDNYRFGSLTLGYKGYKMGINADWVRHEIQNKFAHGFLTNQAFIPRIALSRASYEFKTPAKIPLVVNKVTNLFTHW
jgi:RHS repeat-associated protein